MSSSLRLVLFNCKSEGYEFNISNFVHPIKINAELGQ